ncbi:MAG: NAD(P)-dependent oxidoreductase [Candidatus Cloacimonetes bacterium]|nr:NAD(P)-dependent oxidoreductase [Candidatus Cloacimonadota bacterium]
MYILITGITGFIGGELCRKLLEENQHTITALIREGTSSERYQFFQDNRVKCIQGDITNADFIHSVFKKHKIDLVYHIAAIRGGRDFPMADYYETNVNATLHIAHECIRHECKMIFCSSVGIFGAIPRELPPNEDTVRQNDNYYHYTKIEAEKKLQELVPEGLNLTIIRPSITYGIGDYGFPYTLIKLVDKGIMMLPTKDIMINIVDVSTLIQAFIQAGKANIKSGSAYNIADKIPISIKELVNFIQNELHGSEYPKWKKLPTFLYNFALFIFSKILKNELWTARIELISKNWYYDVTPAVKDLNIIPHNTVPVFEYVINWYKQTKLKGKN